MTARPYQRAVGGTALICGKVGGSLESQFQVREGNMILPGLLLCCSPLFPAHDGRYIANPGDRSGTSHSLFNGARIMYKSALHGTGQNQSEISSF